MMRDAIFTGSLLHFLSISILTIKFHTNLYNFVAAILTEWAPNGEPCINGIFIVIKAGSMVRGHVRRTTMAPKMAAILQK